MISRVFKIIFLVFIIRESNAQCELPSSDLQLPEFKGGTKVMTEFIQKQIKYPQKANIANISGNVFLTFRVTKKGKIKGIKVLRGIGFGCDEEAIRILKLMPLWNPAVKKGEKVSTQFTMPIKFQLPDD